jgi:hypothetical protein
LGRDPVGSIALEVELEIWEVSAEPFNGRRFSLSRFLDHLRVQLLFPLTSLGDNKYWLVEGDGFDDYLVSRRRKHKGTGGEGFFEILPRIRHESVAQVHSVENGDNHRSQAVFEVHEDSPVVPHRMCEDFLSQDRTHVTVVERDMYPVVPGSFQEASRQRGDQGNGARPQHALDDTGVVDLQDGNSRDPGSPRKKGIEIRDYCVNPENVEAINESYHLEGETDKQGKGAKNRGKQTHSLSSLLKREMEDAFIMSLAHLGDNEVSDYFGHEVHDIVTALKKRSDDRSPRSVTQAFARE